MTDQYVRLSYSDDGGNTWSDWQAMPIGELGHYCQKVVWTRLGSTYQRVYKFRVSSPRKRDILGAVTVMQSTTG